MIGIDIQLLEQVLDLTPLGVIIINAREPDKPIVYVNPAFEELSGYDASELTGRAWRVLAADSAEESSWAGGEEVLDLPAPRTTARLRCHGRRGASGTVEIDLAPLYDKPGRPAYWLGTEQREISPTVDQTGTHRNSLLSVLRDARVHLRRLEGKDSATGILNRRSFEQLLQRDWVLARRAQRQLGIVIFRVDALAEYREFFGRHAADSCLRKIAHSITGSLRRAGDLAARFSDDSFVVLIGSSDTDQAVSLAERVAAKVRSLAIHHPRSQMTRFVTVSYGVASEIPPWSESYTGLLERAGTDLGYIEDEDTADGVGTG